ncbi:MAG: hypothetical protein MJY56_06385 [Bacteroidales bacterium]|nr:hypothetical protein [Bacteroidales bacterium]
MKKTILIFLLGCLALGAKAQTPEYVDSLVYRPAASVDESLAGKNIFRENSKNGKVVVHQSPDIENAMNNHFANNRKRVITGDRVRIFFDNRQSARGASEEALARCSAMYHDVRAYRSDVNPYFKVTGGDFRTKSAAMELLQGTKGVFPSAFVVKENINYPVVDKDNAFIVDTVKVLRSPATAEL